MRPEQSKLIAVAAAVVSLLVACTFTVYAPPQHIRTDHSLTAVSPPSPSLSHSLSGWPTIADLARLESTVGHSQQHVIKLLGQPKSVAQISDSEMTWEYDWQASCAITFRSGIVTSTFYTSGF